jgi:NAD(P)-dependent dehydrogenase (short-subunit alcohol dehydrogenase family)
MSKLDNKDIFDLKGRIVIVTGGLGQLGTQYAIALHNKGARVAIVDYDTEFIINNSKLEVINDNDFMFISSDVTDKKSLENALDRITNKWGHPYGLINNAALDAPPNADSTENGPFETYPVGSFEKIMDVNVKGVFLCSQIFGHQMAKNEKGSIVNICSTYGILSPDQRIYKYRSEEGHSFYKPVAYSVSKSALLNMTRYLSTYWALDGVRVNTLTLGGVFNDQDERFIKNYTAKIPLSRMANENEYNGAVIFLMSDASSYMTGSNLVIDGGFSAW